jgi:hypothetical protein
LTFEFVVAAVAQDLSHRQPGERFGVSAASVNRWRALEREQGQARALLEGTPDEDRVLVRLDPSGSAVSAQRWGSNASACRTPA